MWYSMNTDLNCNLNVYLSPIEKMYIHEYKHAIGDG